MEQLRPLFLGIDLGTSAVKALLIDQAGREVAAGHAECKVYQPRPAWQEQDLDEVWQSLQAAVRPAVAQVDPGAIRTLSFSAAMHGLMAADPAGRPLTRMWTWADGRSQEQAESLARELDPRAVFLRTGCPITALYYPARISWLKVHEPEIFRSAARFLSIKDAIVHRLTGRWVADRSHASSNGLLDTRRLEWDAPLLAALGIGPERLPELADSDQPVGELRTEAAEPLGLRPGIPVVPGAGDGGLANLGSGAMAPGQAAATIGTSGAMRKVLSEPWFEPDRRVWCYHLAPGWWYAGGAINNGGSILRWLRDGLLSAERDRALAAGVEPYDRIIALAEQAGPGAEGLIFLPYLHGERTPHWNPRARGVMFGLAPHHGPAHLARAALEGICMCLAQVHELLKVSPGGITEIRASGGFARSAVWVQLLADMLGAPIALPRVRESSALGAAILGMKAAGAIKNLSEAKDLIPIGRTFEPDLTRHAFYQERFEMFKELYRRLEPSFEHWSRLQEKDREGRS
jgi:gluconokinase